MPGRAVPGARPGPCPPSQRRAKVPSAPLVSGTEPERGRRNGEKQEGVRGTRRGSRAVPGSPPGSGHRLVSPACHSGTPGSSALCWGGDGVGGTEEPQPPLCAPSRDRGVVGGQAGGLGGFCDRQEIGGLVWGIPR